MCFTFLRNHFFTRSNPTAEPVIPTGIPTEEAKAEIETQPEAKMS